MPRLTVVVAGERHDLDFAPGPSLREILDPTDYRVRSACLGIGACGLCRIRLLAGAAGAPTAAETVQLEAHGLAAGLRLACQCRPAADLTVEIVNPAARSDWRAPPPGLVSRAALSMTPDRTLATPIRNPLGAAVDLGTSHITVAVCDLQSGQPLALCWGRNPQGRFGADVVTRLMAAEDPAVAAELAAAARNAIGAAFADIAARSGLDPMRIGRVVVVANTAMTALLTGRNHSLLLQPAHWASAVDCTAAGYDWAAPFGIAPGAEIEVVAPLGGFVGSDLLAGLVAVDFFAGEEPALFVDFGTNSEIALRAGGRLWVTAAAGGPAFETGTGSSGMPAETGAVHRVTFDARGVPTLAVFGDDRPRGFCGSGLVDLIAGLRRLDVLAATGRFAGGARRYDLAIGDGKLSLRLADVDALQRAKAAIATGVDLLCREAGVAPHDLRRVVAAGMFGRYLDVANAQSIGMLPAVAAERVELAGNTALTGAVALLLSAAANAQLQRCRADARLLNLARVPAFDDAFLDHLYLRPTET